MDERESAMHRLNGYLQLYHRCTIDDVEITDTPGYWRRKLPCDRNVCHEPIHGCLGNEGPIRHTIGYFDSTRVNNRFASPTRTWKILREAK